MCLVSISYWLIGCSKAEPAWVHQILAYHLSSSGGRKHQWCTPGEREEEEKKEINKSCLATAQVQVHCQVLT